MNIKKKRFDEMEKKLNKHFEKQKNPLCLNQSELLMIRVLRVLHNGCDKGFGVRKIGVGVGNRIIARCKTCNKKYDISDYESW